MKLLYFVEDALENLVKTVTKVESFKNVKEKLLEKFFRASKARVHGLVF